MAFTPTTLATLAIIGFVLIEFVLRKGSTAKSLHTSTSDRGSTIIIVAAYILVALALTMKLPGPLLALPLRWVTGALAIVGVVVRIVAFLTLGSSYTRTLRVESEQSLVTHGIYRWVRHPGYAASILIWAGAAGASGALLALVVVAVVLIAVYAYRIRSEELMLTQSFGEKYKQYQTTSWRLLPYVY
jgi:protein-S-isoprenylcysteine O-methyltransferase Ste14